MSDRPFDQDKRIARLLLTQEVAELTDSVPWKWWAKYQKFDEQNAIGDVLAFVRYHYRIY